MLCAQCNKSIVGKFTTALGKNYHPEHFVCATCKKSLERAVFVEKDGKVSDCHCFLVVLTFLSLQIYCEKDYDVLFSTRCADCGEVIQVCYQLSYNVHHSSHFIVVQGECMQDGEVYWHPDHFKCSFCRKVCLSTTVCRQTHDNLFS
jgi:hypothetical protein